MKSAIYAVAIAAVVTTAAVAAPQQHKANKAAAAKVVATPPKVAEVPPPPPKPHVIPETGTLTADDLVAVAKLVSTATEDKFADDPSSKYVGRHFEVTLKPNQVLVDYDRDAHKLKFSAGDYVDSWELAEELTKSTYDGQNAYGAKATIIKERGNTYGLELPGYSFQRKPYVYSVTMEGPSAKELSSNIRVRVKGVLVKATSTYAVKNSILAHHYNVTTATVSSPIDTLVDQWLLAIRIDAVEFYDARTAAVLPN